MLRFLFIDSDRGYRLIFKLADDPSLALMKYGHYLYKNIIIFAPSVEDFGGDVNIESISKFVDNGGNVLVAGNTASGSAIRELAAEFGFELDEENAAVIDHLSYDLSDDGTHTRIIVPPRNIIDSKYILPKIESPLIYHGTAILVDKNNPLALQILTGNKSSYSYNPFNSVTEYPHILGSSLTLIAALQARNNARVVFSGSIYFFSDNAFTSQLNCVTSQKHYDVSGNKEFSSFLSKWVFGESGYLRVSSIKHHPLNNQVTPNFYTVMDPVVYSIEVDILDSGKWKPFETNDIQMEFVRIDPFVRKTMNLIKPGKYQTTFKIPDTYGVYQFKVRYERIGLSYLNNSTQISVRPLKHTQYERFIPSAYPYYFSAFSMMVGTYLMSFIVLNFKEN